MKNRWKKTRQHNIERQHRQLLIAAAAADCGRRSAHRKGPLSSVVNIGRIAQHPNISFSNEYQPTPTHKENKTDLPNCSCSHPRRRPSRRQSSSIGPETCRTFWPWWDPCLRHRHHRRRHYWPPNRSSPIETEDGQTCGRENYDDADDDYDDYGDETADDNLDAADNPANG